MQDNGEQPRVPEKCAMYGSTEFSIDNFKLSKIKSFDGVRKSQVPGQVAQ